MNNLIKTEDLNGVNTSMATAIRETFNPMADMLERMEDQYNNIINEASQEITEDVTKRAKRTRLDISKVRIATDKARKEQKNQYLIAGRAIDGVANILKLAVSTKEDKLKEIENYFENFEKERLMKLQSDREKQLSKYIDDSEDRHLSSMDEDVWIAYINTKKQEYEDKIRAEKQAELDRIETEKRLAEEREAIELENKKLKREAEEKEKLDAIAKAQREKEEQTRLKNEQIRQAKIEAEKQRQQTIIDEKLRIEKEKQIELKRQLAEQERLNQETLKKAEQERQAKIEAERIAEEKELAKGDIEKIVDLKKDLLNMTEKYSFKSKVNQEKFSYISDWIIKVVNKL